MKEDDTMAIWVRDRSFYKNLLRLAFPITVQSLIAFGINFTDNLMVGSLGEAAIAGVYQGSQIQGFLTMLVAGVEGAIMVLSAQYWGKKDMARIREIIGMGSVFSLILGVLFFIFSLSSTQWILHWFSSDPQVISEGVRYLRIVSFSFLFFSISQILISSMRSVESVNIGMFMTTISFVMNIVLNYVLIFGKLGIEPMGVAGAALATTICRFTEMVIMLIYVLKVDRRLHMKVRDFKVSNPVLVKDFFRYGSPVILGQLVWSINMLMQGVIIGWLNSAAIAAVSVSNMLFNLVYIGMGGLGSAVSVITGKTVGAGQFDLMKQYAKTVQMMFFLIGIVCGLLIFFLKGWFISLYALEPETIAIATQFLTILSFTAVGTSYQASCLAGLVKAGGDTSFVFINDTLFVFLIVLPSAIIALKVFNAPAWVAFLCLKSDQILKCFVALVKINRFNWMKNLTREFN